LESDPHLLARRSPANRNALRALLKPETTIWQYTHDAPDPALVSPDGYSLDNYYLARPGADDVQLDLFGDYKAKVALYPAFQSYFRTHKPPLLAARGKKTPSFFRRAPRLSNATFPTPSFAFSTPATSRWRLTLQRLHPPYATFFPADSRAVEKDFKQNGQSEELGELMAFFVSRRARFVTGSTPQKRRGVKSIVVIRK
jgi:hypothetical protein